MNYTKIAFQILVVAILIYKLWKQTKDIGWGATRPDDRSRGRCQLFQE